MIKYLITIISTGLLLVLAVIFIYGLLNATLTKHQEIEIKESILLDDLTEASNHIVNDTPIDLPKLDTIYFYILHTEDLEIFDYLKKLNPKIKLEKFVPCKSKPLFSGYRQLEISGECEAVIVIYADTIKITPLFFDLIAKSQNDRSEGYSKYFSFNVGSRWKNFKTEFSTYN